MIERSFPIIGTRDLARAIAVYTDLLGGLVSYRFPSAGDPEYVTVRLGPSSLGIALDPAAPEGGARGFELCVYVGDVDAVVARLRRAGARVIDEPADQPWGERMARIADPDGNRLALFAAPATAS
jgi:predicted enzyme related to lactoylglutathione lyase